MRKVWPILLSDGAQVAYRMTTIDVGHVGAVPVLAQHVEKTGSGCKFFSGSRSAGIESARIYRVYTVRVYRFAMRGRSSCSQPPRDLHDASHHVAELEGVSHRVVVVGGCSKPSILRLLTLSLLCLLIHL